MLTPSGAFLPTPSPRLYNSGDWVLEGRRAPQGLDAEDKLAFGLSAAHLGYLIFFSLLAYAVLSAQLPGLIRYPLGVIAVVIGVLFAWGRVNYRPVDEWAWRWLRYMLRPRRSPAAINEEPTHMEEEPEEDESPRILPLPSPRVPIEDTDLQDPQADSDVEHVDGVPVFIGTTQRIAFFAVKGGVGKTTLACETAALLARIGHFKATATSNPEPLRVALLDLDVASANVAMRVGLTHPTLWDLVMEPDPTPAQIEACLLHHDPSGLRVLLGPPRAISATQGHSLALQRIAEVLSYLDEQGYHVVIVDMGTELNDLNTYLLEAVHHIYYVLTPTASAVQDTYRGVETMRRLGYRRKLRLVLNQARPGFDIDEMVQDLGARLAARVAHDDKFGTAEERHRPGSLDQHSSTRQAILPLAAAVYPAIAQEPASHNRWRGFWKRLG
jgi:MinD-like ATPase involved in chromosome partitioning or flagellar assembly